MSKPPVAKQRTGSDVCTRRAVRLEDFTEEEIGLIAKAEVPSEHAALDVEMKDWKF